MSSELYVYYKLEAAKADEVLAAFGALRESLRRQWPALQSRLLKRPLDAQPEQTWMEIHVWPDGEPPSNWQLQLESMAQPLFSSLVRQRHCELFEPLH